MRTGPEALAALRALPCGAALLRAAEGLPVALVGGAVRDLLLGRPPRELDVAVEDDAALEALLGRLGGTAERHDRFGTAVVTTAEGCAVDLARTRAEAYDAPGALPAVRPAPLEEDLLRRDFAAHAIALRPDGTLVAAPHGLADLEAGRLRVLHDASFRDDPTRLWRLVRYTVRLGFLPEERTDALAREAVRDGALATVSGDRLGNELRLALAEPDPPAVLHAAQGLGLVEGLRIDPGLVSAALALLPAGEGDPRLVVLGALVPDARWAHGRGFTAAQERVLARCAELAPVRAGRPSEVAAQLRGEPVEAVAVAGARGDVRAALRWLAEDRHVGLAIGGEDLLAAGVPAGPEVGARLRRALDAKLDGKAPDESSELRVALAG